jgi:DNA-binding NarL/FixJ family response regulator
MSDTAYKINEYLAGRVHLLIIDDDSQVRDMLTGMFSSSSLVSITSGASCRQAFELITNAQHPWHCWILDIALDEEKDGLTILKRYPRFPFTIMLSGLRSMTTATEALKLGAMKVYDKDPSSLDELYESVCKIAAMGFVLNGKNTQYLSQFSFLLEKPLKTAEQWAETACISPRQFDRICTSHTSLTARLLLPFYYTLYVLLNNEIRGMVISEPAHNDANAQNLHDCYSEHVQFVADHLEKYQHYYGSFQP